MNSKPVTMFECGTCHQKHNVSESAEKCCVCEKCGVRHVRTPEHGGWRDKRCERCAMKDFIREAQVRIRREEHALTSSQEHLAKLQAEYAALKAAEKATAA